MKIIKSNVVIVSLLALIAVGINGCREVGPQLPWGHSSVLSDTTYVDSHIPDPEQKNILIEELTGVSCVNCPDGHDIVKGILTTASGRAVAVAIHGSIEPAALDESIPGLTTQVLHNSESQQLIEFFGEPGSRPRGAVDRVIHNENGIPQIWQDRSFWGGYATAQLALNTPVNINVTNTFDSATKTIAMAVELRYTAFQPDTSQSLSIFLTEDSIITAQLNGTNIDTFYVHNGVFRKAVTALTGDRLNVAIKPGTVVVRTYAYTITDPLWKPEHMHIVAFVNKNGNPSPEVLQVKMKAVKP